MESSALIAQTRKSVKKLKDGEPRPFFVVKEGKQAEIFICARPGPASQFKSAKQINKYVAKKALGEPLSDKASTGAGLVTWAGGTCFFDLSIKKGVGPAALQKAIKAAKAAIGIKRFKLGQPEGEAAEGAGSEAQPPPPAERVATPPGDVVNEIRGRVQHLDQRIRGIQGDLNNMIGRSGERVSQLGAEDLETVVKRMQQHDVELKGLVKELKLLKKRLNAAIKGAEKPAGYDDLADLIEGDLLIAESVVSTHIPSSFEDIQRRRAELAGSPSPAPPPPPANVGADEPSPEEAAAQILAAAQKRDERIRNIQIDLNSMIGRTGERVSQLDAAALETVVKRVQELDVELKQHLKEIATAKARLAATVEGGARPAGYDQAAALLASSELTAGSIVQTHIPSSFDDIRRRRAEVRR